MAGPLLKTCCRCLPLRTGSIITGIATILMSIVTIIIVLTVRAHFKTILFDFLPPSVVKIVIVFNLCMTILISAIMIIGAIKVKHFSRSRCPHCRRQLNQHEYNWLTVVFFLSALYSTAKSLFDATVGCSWIYVNHFIIAYDHLYGRHIYHRWAVFGCGHLVYCWFDHNW